MSRAMIRMGVVFVVAAAVSLLASPLVGCVVVGVGAILVLGYEAIRPNGVLRAAETSPHPRGDGSHVLVVADAPLAGDELAHAVAEFGDADAELDVLAPQLVSPLEFAMSDTDASALDAETRLRTSLAWAEAHGFKARGEVGSDEPAVAMADELREFGADAIVIATNGHPSPAGPRKTNSSAPGQSSTSRSRMWSWTGDQLIGRGGAADRHRKWGPRRPGMDPHRRRHGGRWRGGRHRYRWCGVGRGRPDSVTSTRLPASPMTCSACSTVNVE
jgi:nucleotide-binding universal stress UspA family protein